VMDDGWIKTDRGWLKRYGPPADPVARSHLACPQVISDGMEPTEHIDGKHYSSKSAFRAVTKANGMVEVGNDPARLKKPERKKPDVAARKAAVAKAVSKIL